MSEDNVPIWASVGEEAFEEEDKKLRKLSGNWDPKKIFRFFMSDKTEGEPRKIVFLDNLPFNVYMHHFAVNGKWGNWEACPMHNGPISDWCPLCERRKNKEKVMGRHYGHYTILDLTGYESDGDLRMPIKILPADEKLIALLKTRREKAGGNFKGALFTVVRTKKSKNALGNVWDFERHVDLDKLLAKHLAEIKFGLDFLPKEWGFWEGSEDEPDDRRNYKLQGLPFHEFLGPQKAEALKEHLDQMSGGGHGSSGGSSSGSGSSGGFNAAALDEYGDDDDTNDIEY